MTEGRLRPGGGHRGVGRWTALALGAALALGGLVMPEQPSLAVNAHAGTTAQPAATGVDVSWPQCQPLGSSSTESLPTSVGFAVVGVNGGTPDTENSCLENELVWAASSATGEGGAHPVSLYLNTADPGDLSSGAVVADWPSSGTTPYGTCTSMTVNAETVGQNSQACAFEYGEQHANQSFTDAEQAIAEANVTLDDAKAPSVGAPGSLPWWLDVETANTWQTGSNGVAMNVADLWGVISGLRSAGVTATIGIYSSDSDWELITGDASYGAGVPDWVPGSANQAEAAALCGTTGFSGSAILLAQYPETYQAEDLDGDVACLTLSAPGYRLAAKDGGIFSFDAPFEGSMGGQPLNAPVVGMASTLSGNGYWEVASDGGVFTFGDATFYGSMGGQPLNEPIVGMAADPATGGYWEVASDGGIFSFGAPFYGSMGGQPLNEPIVGMAVTPDGGGYWLVASDGGIFSFGAPFYGSMGGQPLNEPIVGMAADPATGGYREVASDGGIFSFDAPFEGSMGGQPLNAPVVGMASTASGNGYWEVASDGGIFSFGDATFYGSMGGQPLVAPIVGMGTA